MLRQRHQAFAQINCAVRATIDAFNDGWDTLCAIEDFKACLAEFRLDGPVRAT